MQKRGPEQDGQNDPSLRNLNRLGSILNPEQLAVIEPLRAAFNKGSNLEVTYMGGFGLFLEAAVKTDQMTEDELFEWADRTQPWPYRNLFQDNPSATPEEYRAVVLESAADRKRKDLIGGGMAITSRTLADVENTFPSITERLDRTRGKIVFLGNGFSDVPLLYAERYEQKLLEEPTVVADLVNYPFALTRLEWLKQSLQESGFAFPFENQLATTRRLVTAASYGDLQLVQWLLGHEAVPEIVKEAELAINVFGPPVETLPDQLKILKRQGVLVTTYRSSTVPEGFADTTLFGKYHGIERVI